MKYESLNKIYHKRPNSHDQIYIERYNSSMTRHFNFQIQEYNHRNKFQAFFCYTEDFAMLMEEIYQKHEDLLQALDSVPSLVMEQFLLSSIVDEVRATSDIEGIDIRSFYDEFAHKEIAAENPINKLDGKLFRKDSVDITSTAGKIIHRGIYPEEKRRRYVKVPVRKLSWIRRKQLPG